MVTPFFERSPVAIFAGAMLGSVCKALPAAILLFRLRLRQISRKILQRGYGHASGFFVHLPCLA